ncbi:MAG: glycosyltransferase [Bifidobacterium aquikefiri]|uniref:Glycosyl transferase n=1 Tax=Bifidobacterium aquikefiri TaxID=1653207 RepID=A0A261G8N3_9BIFI|nr:glycosyltransferase [Bifidobacterium aquikefiri]OZG67764.1 glycosyl transferase [Bifidobacterium aquikefiri]
MPVSKPLVSIIVPVYNAERYLRHCVDSILGQSYRNLQILLIDDGATDASGDMCDEYAAHDSRVTVIHKHNGGIASAQNAGLDAATGDCIAFCDNDDIMHNNNVEHLLMALQKTHADMAKGRWNQIGVSELPVTIESASQAQSLGALTLIDDPLNAYQSVFCKTLRILGGAKTEARYFNEANWCRLYRRELWDGLRFKEGHYAQDIRMAGPLYARTKRVVDVNEVLYYWLQEPDSVTHSQRTPAFWHDNVTAAAENFEFTLSHGVVPYRNYFGLTASVRDEKLGLRESSRQQIHASQTNNDDYDKVRLLVARLSHRDRLKCRTLAIIRRGENKIYDQLIHAMQ